MRLCESGGRARGRSRVRASRPILVVVLLLTWASGLRAEEIAPVAGPATASAVSEPAPPVTVDPAGLAPPVTADPAGPVATPSALVDRGASPMPAAELPRAFSPGEELVYAIEALGMDAGKGRVTVGTPTDRDGVRALPIVAQGRTDSLFDRVFSVRDKFISWWDPATGRVIGSDLQADEGGKKSRSRSVLDHKAGKAYVRREKATGERTQSTYDLPAGAFDIAGAVMELRNRKLEPGTTEEVKVFTGRKTFTMRCRVEGLERITVPAGSFEAISTMTE